MQLDDGSQVIIEKIEYETTAEQVTTYNFEVKDYHTYYVTESNVLCHNVCENAAMRAAKRSENIPMNAKPDYIKYENHVLGANGKYYSPKTYVFGDKFIRNDFGGHMFYDGAIMKQHFNAGRIIDGKFIGNKAHFFYGG